MKEYKDFYGDTIDSGDIHWFTRGYIDATHDDEPYQSVGISPEPPYIIVDSSELRYRSDVPENIIDCKDLEELRERLREWEYEGQSKDI